jgi:hypothetical protein
MQTPTPLYRTDNSVVIASTGRGPYVRYVPFNRVSSTEPPTCSSQHCLLRAPRSEERGSLFNSLPLLEQVDDGGDEVRDGVIDDYVTVVVSHLVARGRWRQVAVDILGHRLQIFDVCVGIVAADIECRAIGAIDLAHTG